MIRRVALLTAFFLLAAPSALGQEIPGVPSSCCGRMECRPAVVEVVSRGPKHTVVRVDGRTLILSSDRVKRSSRVKNSWYCSSRPEAPPAEESTLCVVDRDSLVKSDEVIFTPLRGVSNAGLHFLAELPCVGCHTSRPAPWGGRAPGGVPSGWAAGGGPPSGLGGP